MGASLCNLLFQAFLAWQVLVPRLSSENYVGRSQEMIDNHYLSQQDGDLAKASNVMTANNRREETTTDGVGAVFKPDHKKRPKIIHRKPTQTASNTTYVMREVVDERSVNDKGMLLDIFYKGKDLTVSQARTLVMMMSVGLLSISTLLIATCLVKSLLVCKSGNTKFKAETLDSVKSIDHHKGGGGI